jgi:thiamine-monophosphate kinase
MSDYDKIKHLPDFTIIGHMTPKTSGINLIAKAGTSHPIQAQGWNAFKQD